MLQRIRAKYVVYQKIFLYKKSGLVILLWVSNIQALLLPKVCLKPIWFLKFQSAFGS